MVGIGSLFGKLRRKKVYGRRQPLILINGLSEQKESWYRNIRFWRRHFDVHDPNIIDYEGARLHERISRKDPIDVEYLVEEYHEYLNRFVQSPPYHLVCSSLGGKITIEFAARYPELVSRIVLLCPSGMGDVERLPIIEGVRRSDLRTLVGSVMVNPGKLDRQVIRYYEQQFSNRRWRTGLLRTIRGTMDHVVRERLADVPHPTLLISGDKDQVVDSDVAEGAAALLPAGHFLRIENCGHAPQIEKPWLINRLVLHFLTSEEPTTHPRLRELLWANPKTIL